MAPFLQTLLLTTTLLGNKLSYALSAPTTTTTPPKPLLTTSGNSRKLLFEETWDVNMSPQQAVRYLMTPETWISIVPESEQGYITNEVKNTGEEGTWSLTTNDGTHLLCRNMQSSPTGEYLSYNVQATFLDGVQFMLDIEYDLAEGKITRTVFDPETLNFKTKMMKPLIRSPLKEMMQEENRRLKISMNS